MPSYWGRIKKIKFGLLAEPPLTPPPPSNLITACNDKLPATLHCLQRCTIFNAEMDVRRIKKKSYKSALEVFVFIPSPVSVGTLLMEIPGTPIGASFFEIKLKPTGKYSVDPRVGI